MKQELKEALEEVIEGAIKHGRAEYRITAYSYNLVKKALLEEQEDKEWPKENSHIVGKFWEKLHHETPASAKLQERFTSADGSTVERFLVMGGKGLVQVLVLNGNQKARRFFIEQV